MQSTGLPDLEFALKLGSAVVTLVVAGYAMERRMRDYVDRTYQSKEAANQATKQQSEQINDLCHEIDCVKQEYMPRSAVLAENRVLAAQFEALKSLEQEHHATQTANHNSLKREVLDAIGGLAQSIKELNNKLFTNRA